MKALFISIILSLVASGTVLAQGVYAFRSVNVIPMDAERVLENQTVIVRSDRIASIRPAGEVEIPKGATVIDATGKYFIPGLADMHIHLRNNEADSKQMLVAYAATGVTTVLNLGGGNSRLHLRELIREGEIIGPTIFSCGDVLGTATVTAADGESAVREQRKQGYDVIKVYNAVAEEAYFAVIKTAKELDMPVIGHAVRSVGIVGVLQAGQSLAHGEEFIYGYFQPPFRDPSWPKFPSSVDVKGINDWYLVESAIPALTRKVKEAGIFVTPNLVAYHMFARQIEDLESMLARPEVRFVPANVRDEWGPERNAYTNKPNLDKFLLTLKIRLPFLRKLTMAFQNAGVPLLMGTDAPVGNLVPGFSAHDELQELVDSGLTPYDALLTATRRPAEFFDQADEFGTIAEGLRADLILLDANPLEDISNTKHRSGVMVRGQWRSDEEFMAILAQGID